MPHWVEDATGIPLTPQMAGECPARWRQKRAEDEFARRAVEEEKIPGLDVTKGHSEGLFWVCNMSLSQKWDRGTSFVQFGWGK